jgi:hypothetical protein
MLERAMPADAVPGSTIPENSEAEVQLRDGSWIWCQVIGQRKDRQGRWCVGIRWYVRLAVCRRPGRLVCAGRLPDPAVQLNQRAATAIRDMSTPSAPRSSGLAQ